MSKRILSGFCLAVILVSAGCSPNASDSPKGGGVRERVTCENGFLQPEGTNAIIGGNVVPEQTWLRYSSVYLYTEIHNTKEKVWYSGGCTGMLIDQDVVLTAAHCISSESPDEEIHQTYALFTPKPKCNANDQVDLSQGVAVVARHKHPAFDKSGGPTFYRFDQEIGDLALLKLHHQAPANYRIVKLSNMETKPNHLTDLFLAAGYGQTTPHAEQADNQASVLRWTYLTGIRPETASAQERRMKDLVNEFLSQLQLNPSQLSAEETAELKSFPGKQDIFRMGQDRDFIFVEQTLGKGICSGDSGGALYAKRGSEYYVVGVASYVGNAVTQNGFCAGFGAYTNTLKYKSWITETFMKIKGPGSQGNSLFH